jgi:TIGR03118 family protein
MRRYRASFGGTALAAVGFAALLTGCDDKGNSNIVAPVVNQGFQVTRLVADIPAFGAKTVDPNLVNPWGIVFGTTSNLWVANNGTGTSTVYDALGVKQSLTVQIPSPTTASGGRPTGIVSNTTADFVMSNGTAAAFIFAGEDGVISAWNPQLTNAVIVADRSANNSVYKGLAMAQNQSANFLYATDFHNARVDVFDNDFQFVKSFTDRNIPAGFAPFGIANIGGRLYVTFAKQEPPDNEDDLPGPGNGFVDVFNPDGTVASRFASNGSLNSPWAVVLAPTTFGSLGGMVLIGNFGDGLIGAYNPNTGAFVSFVNDLGSSPIRIDGLWGLTFGPQVGSTSLFFASGPNDETHGLVGTITPR